MQRYMQKRGDFPTAISLYEGVNERILDAETNSKIDANINYLKKYRQKQEQQQRQRETVTKPTANEIKISLDSPIRLPEKIQIGFLPLRMLILITLLMKLPNAFLKNKC